MAIENFKEDLASNLKKLAGVVAVGTPWWGFDAKAKPAGVQLFSGQLLSRVSYSAHYELISSKRTVVSESEWQAQVSANGFCPYYSSGDGSTTYRMPLIKGVHPKFVAALAEAGKYVQAGLPNITGSGYDATDTNPDSLLANLKCRGALTMAVVPENRSGYAYAAYKSYTNYAALTFDASRSNPLYGNSNTVQPPAVNIIFGEYVVGAVAALGEANATSLLASVTRLESEVANKIGRSATDKAEVISWGMPDYSAGVIVSSPFTAKYPCLCFVVFQRTRDNDVTMTLNGAVRYLWRGQATYNHYNEVITLYLNEGDTLTFNYDPVEMIIYPLKGA